MFDKRNCCFIEHTKHTNLSSSIPATVVTRVLDIDCNVIYEPTQLSNDVDVQPMRGIIDRFLSMRPEINHLLYSSQDALCDLIS